MTRSRSHDSRITHREHMLRAYVVIVPRGLIPDANLSSYWVSFFLTFSWEAALSGAQSQTNPSN
jgi:hypothetical protein